jgi:hypothetical protein
MFNSKLDHDTSTPNSKLNHDISAPNSKLGRGSSPPNSVLGLARSGPILTWVMARSHPTSCWVMPRTLSTLSWARTRLHPYLPLLRCIKHVKSGNIKVSLSIQKKGSKSYTLRHKHNPSSSSLTSIFSSPSSSLSP